MLKALALALGLVLMGVPLTPPVVAQDLVDEYVYGHDVQEWIDSSFEREIRNLSASQIAQRLGLAVGWASCKQSPLQYLFYRDAGNTCSRDAIDELKSDAENGLSTDDISIDYGVVRFAYNVRLERSFAGTSTDKGAPPTWLDRPSLFFSWLPEDFCVSRIMNESERHCTATIVLVCSRRAEPKRTIVLTEEWKAVVGEADSISWKRQWKAVADAKR